VQRSLVADVVEHLMRLLNNCLVFHPVAHPVVLLHELLGRLGLLEESLVE